MSPPGRHGPEGATSWPFGEYRSAQDEGSRLSQAPDAPVRILDVTVLSDDWYVLKKTTFDHRRRDGSLGFRHVAHAKRVQDGGPYH